MIRFSTYAYSNGTGVFCEKQLRNFSIELKRKIPCRMTGKDELHLSL